MVDLITKIAANWPTGRIVYTTLILRTMKLFTSYVGWSRITQDFIMLLGTGHSLQLQIVSLWNFQIYIFGSWLARSNESHGKKSHRPGKMAAQLLSRLHSGFMGVILLPQDTILCLFTMSLCSFLVLQLFIYVYVFLSIWGLFLPLSFNLLLPVSLLLSQANGAWAESYRDKLPFFITACYMVHMTSFITGNGSFIVWLYWSLSESSLKSTICLHTLFFFGSVSVSPAHPQREMN